MVAVREIKCIIAVYELKSVSRAAQKLYLSQQAISKIIKKTEDDLGVTLFYRTTSGMEATKDGEYFVRLYKPLVNSFEETYQEFLSYSSGEAEVKVAIAPGVFRSLSHRLLVRDPLVEMKQRYKDCKLSFIEDFDRDCIQLVSRGIADIAICPEPIITNTLEYININEEPLYAIMNRNHKFAQRKDICMADLKGQELISLGEAYRIYLLTKMSCKELKFEPNIICTGIEPEQLIRMTKQFQYVFICVKHIAEDAEPECIHIPITDKDMTWRVGILYPKGMLKPQVKRMISDIKNGLYWSMD